MNENNGLIVADRQREYNRMLTQVRANIITRGANLGGLEEQAAQVITEIAVAHGLSPFLGEVTAIPIVKKGKVVGVIPYVGIQGWIRKATNKSFYHIYPDERTIHGKDEPDLIEQMGLTICRKCRGAVGETCEKCEGSGWYRGSSGSPCFNCGGKSSPLAKGTGKATCEPCGNTGRIPPENFIVHELKLMRLDKYREMLNDAKEADALGFPILMPNPTLGRGTWQAGDNVPSTWQPEQVAEKRALLNALRKAYVLPMEFDPSVPMVDVIEGSVVSSHTIEDGSYEATQLGSVGEDAEDAVIVGDDTPVIIEGEGIATFIKSVKDTGYDKRPIELLNVIFGNKYDFSSLTNIAAANALACLDAGLTKEAKAKAVSLTREAKVWPKN